MAALAPLRSMALLGRCFTAAPPTRRAPLRPLLDIIVTNARCTAAAGARHRSDLHHRSYTYTAKTGDTCKLGEGLGKHPPVAGISNFVKLPGNDYASLMNAVGTIGPVSISVDASWGAYEKGVYQGCGKNNHTIIDHAVQAVGYGTEGGTDYWLVRNSWCE